MSSDQDSHLLPLICSVKNYEWGQIGEKSLVYRLARDRITRNDNFYSELWMGTHPNGPSLVEDSEGGTLQSRLNSKLLGALKQDTLPFLFKVLSINKPLSIQAHPNAELAEKLHKLKPNVYRDSNEKSEMIIALTRFQALVGFKLPNDIRKTLRAVPSFSKLLGESVYAKCLDQSCSDEELLALTVRGIISSNPETIAEELENLSININNIKGIDATPAKILLKHYPNDLGCFFSLIMNYIVLEEGESIFIKCMEPHAYLYGDCVECMTSSDNVIRVGCTPKYRDVDTFLKCITYKSSNIKDLFLQPEIAKNGNTEILTYNPPVQEFLLSKVKLSGQCELRNTSSGIAILISGTGIFNGKELSPGFVFFIPANANIHITGQGEMYIAWSGKMVSQ